MEWSFFLGRQFSRLKLSYFKQIHFIAWFLIHTKSVRILCWYLSLWNKTRLSQKPARFLNLLFILRLLACVRAYTMRRADGGRSQTLSPSSTPPRCASVPMKTGGFPALRQSRRLSLRAESPGQGGRADTTYPSTHSPQEKSGKHVRRPVAQFLLAHMRVFRGSGRH